LNEGPIIRYLPLAAAVLLAAGLAWAPIPFGSVEPWAEGLLRLVAAAALAGAAAVGGAGRRLRRVAVPAAALGGLALLGWFQALPLPARLVGLLSPRHREVWERAGALVGEELPARLTLAPEASRETALAFAAAAAALVAAALVASRPGVRRGLLAGLLAGTLFPLAYGLRRWLAGSTEVWGVELVALSDRLRGTFVNPNHFAVQLEIALAVVFAWGWWALRRGRGEASIERRLLLAAPPAALWLLLFAGLAFTGSRAGLLAALAALAVQTVLPTLAGGGRRWRRVALGVAAGLAGLAAVVAAVGVQVGFGRLLATSAEEVTLGARTRVAAQSLEVWRGYPLTGSGLGTFRDAFPRVQAADQWTGAWHHAHDDWLELLVTGGLVGAALLAAGLVALVRRLLRVLREARHGEQRAAALAALGALAAVGIHEAFDFGLTLPANAFALAVLCGAAAGASTDHGQAAQVRRRSRRRRDLDEVEAGSDVAGGAGASAAPRAHHVEQPAVDVNLDEAGGLSLGDFEDDPGRRS
jgi:O-antigen ligase